MREQLIGEPQVTAIGYSGIYVQIPDIYNDIFTNRFVKFAENRLQKHLFEPISSTVRQSIEEDILSSYLSAVLECARKEILRK